MTDELRRLKAVIDRIDAAQRKLRGDAPAPAANVVTPDQASKAQSDVAAFFGEREEEMATDVNLAVADWFASRRGEK